MADPATTQKVPVSPGFEPRPSLSAGCRHAVSPTSMQVSPGFEPRPSLSAHRLRASPHSGQVSPGFEPRPSLSVALRVARSRPSETRVAGVRTPAFVERCSPCGSFPPGKPVSPGFEPRPSLSDRDPGIAGAPADVSPGFEPRPSLSVDGADGCSQLSHVSPGFEPRPSLSAPGGPAAGGWGGAGVAGVRTPAFVERVGGPDVLYEPRRVAGVRTPAFVERTHLWWLGCPLASCRRGSNPGLR